MGIRGPPGEVVVAAAELDLFVVGDWLVPTRRPAVEGEACTLAISLIWRPLTTSVSNR
jgi:hypothetical protein